MVRNDIKRNLEQFLKNVQTDYTSTLEFADKRRRVPKSIKQAPQFNQTPFGPARAKNTKTTKTTNSQIAGYLLKRGFKFNEGYSSNQFWQKHGYYKSLVLLFKGRGITKNRVSNLNIAIMKRSISETKGSNKPSTIKIKGRNKPANDTLQFLQSVSAVEPNKNIDLLQGLIKNIVIDR